MILSGQFTTRARRTDLRAALDDPDRFSGVPGVRDLEVGPDGVVRAVFTPRTGLGVTPLRMRVSRGERAEPDRAVLTAQGVSGPHAIDLEVELRFAEQEGGTEVTWVADLRVRGVLASTAQRVIGDIARAEIERLLTAAAEVVAAA